MRDLYEKVKSLVKKFAKFFFDDDPFFYFVSEEGASVRA